MPSPAAPNQQSLFRALIGLVIYPDTRSGTSPLEVIFHQRQFTTTVAFALSAAVTRSIVRKRLPSLDGR